MAISLKKLSLLALAALAAVALAAAPGMANLILNPSFEDGIATIPDSPGFVTVNSGDNGATIQYWNVTGGTVDYIGKYWTAADGSRSIDLNGDQPGAMAQTQITGLTQGQEYVLTFALAGNPDGGPAVKTLDVSIDGTLPQHFFFDTAGKSDQNMGWVDQSFTFTADATTATLLFQSTTGTQNGDSYFGPALDNVRLNPVPLPASVLLLGSGFMGLGLLGWRRKS